MEIRQELNNKLNVVITRRYCIAFSYTTIIGILDKRTNTARITEEKHSNTTCRHRKFFEREYCGAEREGNTTKFYYISQEELEDIAEDIINN